MRCFYFSDTSPTSEAKAGKDRSFSVVSNPDRFNRLITFGRQLQGMLQDLETTRGIKCDKNTKMLQDAFALLAYPDPWESPVGWQLEASEREFVSGALNSAILESQCNQPGRPPLQVSNQNYSAVFANTTFGTYLNFRNHPLLI